MAQSIVRSKKEQRPTTLVRLPDNFRERAEARPVHGMFYMFMAAFGYTLADAQHDIEQMIAMGHWNMFALCIAASIQVRGNVVALREDIFGIKAHYPKIYLPGRQGKDDTYNFFALHLLGHAILSVAPNHRHAVAAFQKAGNCITGEHLTEIVTEAQQINKEIADSWSAGAKTAFAAWVEAHNNWNQLFTRILDAVEPFAIEFAAYLADSQDAPEGTIEGRGAAINVNLPPA